MNKLNQGIVYLKEKSIKSFLAGFIYFLISNKNKYVENLIYVLIKFSNIKRKYVKTRINNLLMILDLGDKGISRELSVNKKREFFSTDFIKKVICKDDLVLDIGANIGYYALLEGNLAKKVYAIEPIPHNRALLKKNLELNGLKNVRVFEEAIGNKVGKSKMYVYNKCNWCSFSKNLDGKIIKTLTVKINTIDNFIKKNLKDKLPTFIRMDVEGYESEILKGMQTLLKSNKPLKLFIEIHTPQLNLTTQEKLRYLLETMKNNGFKISAFFLEPEPANFNSLRLTNRLSDIMGVPRLGPQIPNYTNLKKILNSKDLTCQPMVFFERD